jgi:DnaK suppressor protein
MDEQRARALLNAERDQIQELIDEAKTAGSEDRSGANEPGDMTDPAPSLISEEENDEVIEGFRERLEAIKRAEQRLADGTYGRSILSGAPIPDERLEAEPAAELTVEEANVEARKESL